MNNFSENKKKFHDLCESYGVYYFSSFFDKSYHVYYFSSFFDKSYHVSNNYEGKGGCIIPWEHLSVRNPDWEWIEERIITVSLEVFR